MGRNRAVGDRTAAGVPSLANGPGQIVHICKWLIAITFLAALVVGCGGGKSYEEVLQAIRSSTADDAAKAFREADLGQEERFAIDAFCTTTDTYNDEGQAPSAFDWVGVYRRSITPPSGLSVGTVRSSVDRLDTTLNLAQVSPPLASRYVQFCVAR
jgi:hypothetical protein